MSTDISIPSVIHTAAESLAQRLGVSVSALYEAALAAYLNAHPAEEVTEALNRVYDAEPSAMDTTLVRVQLQSVGGRAW